jgi:hypothetical protein
VAGGYVMVFSWVAGAQHWIMSDVLVKSTNIGDELYRGYEDFMSNKS